MNNITIRFEQITRESKALYAKGQDNQCCPDCRVHGYEDGFKEGLERAVKEYTVELLKILNNE